MSQSPTPTGDNRVAVLPVELFNQVVAFLAQKHSYAEIHGLMAAIQHQTQIVQREEPKSESEDRLKDPE